MARVRFSRTRARARGVYVLTGKRSRILTVFEKLRGSRVPGWMPHVKEAVICSADGSPFGQYLFLLCLGEDGLDEFLSLPFVRVGGGLRPLQHTTRESRTPSMLSMKEWREFLPGFQAAMGKVVVKGLEKGKPVSVVSGPFKGFSGIVDSVNPRSGMVDVKFIIMKREIKTTVPIDAVGD